MKTHLTEAIQKQLSYYSPEKLSGYKLNKFRQSFGAEEVTVSNSTVTDGIVDYMRFDEYEKILGTHQGCKVCNKHYQHWFTNSSEGLKCKRGFTDWREAMHSPECLEKCRNSVIITDIDYLPLFTCFEIKITNEDFHSKHGHNFVGNLNYYVMPMKLYKQVKNEIPNNIGVISIATSIDSEGEHITSCRQIKEAVFKELSEKEMFERLLCLTKAVLKRKDLLKGESFNDE